MKYNIIKKVLMIISMVMFLSCFTCVNAYSGDTKITSLYEQYVDFLEIYDDVKREYIDPIKKEYVVGEKIDLTGGELKLIANEGSIDEEILTIPYTSSDISIEGFYDMNKRGSYFVNIVFNDAPTYDRRIISLNIYVNEANEIEDVLNDNIGGENLKHYVVTRNDNSDTFWLKKLYNIDNLKIPNKFNLAEKINLEVEDQENKGLCYLFALLKSVETNVALTHGKKQDFSASYIDYMTSDLFYGERELGQGMEPTFFLQWAENYGLALEEEIPYGDYEEDEYEKLLNASLVSKIKSTISFPGIIKENSEFYKAHVMQFGSLALVIPTPDRGTEYFNSETKSYYYKKGMPYSRGTHAISIIGWDDNYSRENFKVKPENDGAWIAQNSWGEDWGNKGIFYISYEDEGIFDTFSSATFGIISVGKAYERIEYTYSDFAIANKRKFDSNNTIGSENIAMPYNKKTFLSVEFDKKNDIEYLDGIYLSEMIVIDREIDDEILSCKFYIVDNYDGTNIMNYRYLGEARCYSNEC